MAADNTEILSHFQDLTTEILGARAIRELCSNHRLLLWTSAEAHKKLLWYNPYTDKGREQQPLQERQETPFISFSPSLLWKEHFKLQGEVSSGSGENIL